MKVLVLVTFHYPAAEGIRTARTGDEIELPEADARVFASGGRVRLLEESQPDTDAIGAMSFIAIPENWQALSWPELKSLASKLSDTPIKSKADAVAAIESALPRVAPAPAGS